MDDTNIYLSMESYITRMLESMNLSDLAHVSTPISDDIRDLSPLCPKLRKEFMTGVGCVGWLANTVRLDVALAHSRIAQHMAKPTAGALKALRQCIRYLASTRSACIYQPLSDTSAAHSEAHGWRFFCDSDDGSAAHNEGKAQKGFLAKVGTAPVSWACKVHKCQAYANEKLATAHPDRSTGAHEVYAAGDASFEMLYLSYVIREMQNIPFPSPMTLEMDNSAAEVFAKNSSWKSRLKHIDKALDWVRCLRDPGILIATHVPTAENLSDIVTKTG